MKRFRYRLERVLHFRQLVEAEAKRQLQLAQRALAEAESDLSKLEQELVKDFSIGSSVVGIELWLLETSYRSGVRNRIASQEIKIATLREECVTKMTAYREAARELESLQRHRKTKVVEYDQAVATVEQAQIDELTVQRHGRRSSMVTRN